MPFLCFLFNLFIQSKIQDLKIKLHFLVMNAHLMCYVKIETKNFVFFLYELCQCAYISVEEYLIWQDWVWRRGEGTQ